jgi:GNAT superfamily N-acetyltransferase
MAEILALVAEIKEEMNAQGIEQWNEEYPKPRIFTTDVESGTLYALKENQEIIGIIVLSEFQDKEYEDIEWSDETGDYLVIHRIGVHPKWQRKGIATRMMDFAEDYAREHGYNSIRLDTYSGNPRSLELFKKKKYKMKEGHIHFPECKDPYYCFEKIINSSGKTPL